MKTKFYLSLAGLVLVVSAVIGLNYMGKPASALRYCDDNSIIRCGALSASELQEKYNANDRNTQAIFNHYGITSSMVAGAGSAKIGTVKKNGEVVVDGKVIATAAQTVGRHNVSGSTPVQIGGSTYYQRRPADVFIVDSQQAFVFLNSNGEFVAAVLQPCGNPIVATPVPKPKPTPVYSCDSLTVTPISRTSFELKETHTVTNATFVRSTFIVRNAAGAEVSRQDSTTGSVTVDQTTPGTYSAEVQIVVSVDGQEKVATDAKCKKSFTVKKAPSYECVKLEKIKKSRDTFEFKTTATAKDGATIKQVLVEFGEDNKSQIVEYGTNATHTYTAPGTYTAVATVTFVVDGAEVQQSSDNCKVKVTVDQPPVEECKPGIPVGDDRCKEECKPGIPVGDDRCKEVLPTVTPPTTPPIIAETGPEALLGGLAGTGALGLGATSFIRSRRAIKNSLFKQ